MTDDALLELRRLSALVEALHRALVPPADPRHAELLDALGAVFGSAPFTACEAIEVARTPLGDRRRLKAALQAVGARDAQRLGMTLSALEKRAAGRSTRLARLGTEGGKRLWSVVDLVEPGCM